MRVIALGLVLNETSAARARQTVVAAQNRHEGQVQRSAHVHQPLGLILAQTEQPGYVQAAVTYGRELSCIFIADATFTSSLHRDVNTLTFI